MTTHAPKTPMEYTRDITSLFNSYCRDIDIESITEPRKKKQAERLCNERASNTIDTLFRIPPASWRPVHTHESTFRLPPLETWKVPARRVVDVVSGSSGDGAVGSRTTLQHQSALKQTTQGFRQRGELR